MDLLLGRMMQDVQPHRAPLELPHPVTSGSDETDIGSRSYRRVSRVVWFEGPPWPVVCLIIAVASLVWNRTQLVNDTVMMRVLAFTLAERTAKRRGTLGRY
ncbi:MAG: hypothetical protein HOV83_40140 [Catenulispora sp.]|nr:hypothetical protein [Catenulispora sp.]